VNEAVHQFVNDTDPTMRRLAVGLVVRHGACSHVDALTWLCDRDTKIQDIVLRTVGIEWYLPEAADTVPALLQCFDLTKEAEFFRIQRHLKALRTLARPALPDVLRLAERSDLRNRLQIIETLAAIGAEPDDLVRLSAPLLLHPNGGPPACRILARASPEEAKRQVSLLIPQLQERDGTVNVHVLDALGAFGDLAREAVPALVPRLARNDLESVCRVVATLGKIAPEAAAPAVPRLVPSIDLEHLDPFFYKQPPAIDALGELGRSAREAVPTLLKVLDISNASMSKGTSTRNYLRPLVTRALARTGGDRADVVAALHKLRTHDDESAWLDAAQWLGSSEITTPSVLAALTDIRNDKNAGIRVHAIWAILNQTVDHDEAVARLLEEFASDDPAIRTAAAVALGELGTSASPAVQALRDSLNNAANSKPNRARGSAVYVWQEGFYCTSVASAVRWALWRIEPPSDDREP
jgi:HEAT repeat protein